MLLFWGIVQDRGHTQSKITAILILLSVLFSVLFLSPFYFYRRFIFRRVDSGNFVDGG
nr:MAG TPA: hypothetical protein [Caudoviricetes sp.]